MYITKTKNPRTDPWVAPNLITDNEELCTLWRININVLIKVNSKPINKYFEINSKWLRVSKAYYTM